MIKYFYCEDLNIIKKEVNYNTSFSNLHFNTTTLISDINITDMFYPTNDFLVLIDDINIDDILFVNKSLLHDGKNITFVLPRELRPKELEFFIINNLSYEHLKINTLTLYNFLNKYIIDNNIQIDPSIITKIAEYFDDINIAINEIDKLVAFAYPNKIEEKHFKLISTNIEIVDIFKLIELYLRGDNVAAITLFDKLVDSGYSEGALIETMYKQIRLLLQVQALRNNSSSSIAGILKINQYRIKHSIKLLNRVDKKNLYKFLKNIALVDWKYKNGLSDMENIKLDIIII